MLCLRSCISGQLMTVNALPKNGLKSALGFIEHDPDVVSIAMAQKDWHR